MNEAGLGYPHKIVTCCYCGTRAALVLRGRTRHELSCSSCGAPLHDLKMLPTEKTQQRTAQPPRQSTGRREGVDRGRPHPARPQRPVQNSRPPRKKRKFMKKFLEEAFDILEDIFD